MEPEEAGRQTFVEFVLALLEERFPWLGSRQDEPVSGADAVDELTDLYRSLTEQRGRSNRKDAGTESKMKTARYHKAGCQPMEALCGMCG